MLLARTTRPAKDEENEASCECEALGRMGVVNSEQNFLYSPLTIRYSRISL
jgi:hypothetical protein